MRADVKERATIAVTSTSGWGAGTVRNRRLCERLAGSDEWDEFDATVAARPLPGGLGNEDEFRTDYGGGFVGMSFRFFDPETELWSIYWADTRRPGLLDPPVIGIVRRRHRASSRATTRSTAGRSVVRFTWSGVTTPTPRWEQAFSDDDGETWETNWVMDFTRAGGRVVSALEQVGAITPSTATPRRSPRPEPSITLGDAILKWYDIAPAETPVPIAVRALARRMPARRGEGGRRSVSRTASGSSILHRCGEDFYFLIVSHVAKRQRALGDGLGEERRAGRRSSVRGRSEGRTARRSASGSSAPSATSARRGASTSARRATSRRGDVPALLRTRESCDGEHARRRGSSSSSASSAEARGTGRATCAIRSNGASTPTS